MASKIIQASIDENKKIRGGKAGDQTGKEVNVSNWYKYGWNCMIRCVNAANGKKAAEIEYKLAVSNIVGYDQTIEANNGRNTLYQALKKYDFDVDKLIKAGKKCECDCSELPYAAYCCLYPELRSDSNAPNTSSWPDFAKAHPKVFKVYTSDKYLNTSAYLKPGDILGRKGSHIVTFYGELTQTTPVTTETTVATYKLTGNMNVREGAGTKYDVVCVAKSGTTVSVSKVSNGWGYVPALKGYISLGTKYTELVSTGATKYKLTGNMNIRNGRGTKYDIVCVAKSGTTVSVTDISDGWGYVASLKGYISLGTQYTVKV